MTNPQGKFVWYELMTTDTSAAESFYRDVIGWSARDAGMPGMAYTIFSAGELGVGGLMTLPEDAKAMGAPPHWVGYIWVEDVDRKAVDVKEGGGAVYKAPGDIPGVGRFAVVADPQGATFALFKDNGQQRPETRGLPGHGGWHELHAKNGASAFDFYAKLVGWTKSRAMDMGPMGVYQIFAENGADIGGMMTSPAAASMATWLFYFNVGSIEAAEGRVKAAGGQILNGPHEVPGGQWILQCRDPQGAMFALVGTRN
jgi:uncharacterized protein